MAILTRAGEIAAEDLAAISKAGGIEKILSKIGDFAKGLTGAAAAAVGGAAAAGAVGGMLGNKNDQQNTGSGISAVSKPMARGASTPPTMAGLIKQIDQSAFTASDENLSPNDITFKYTVVRKLNTIDRKIARLGNIAIAIKQTLDGQLLFQRKMADYQNILAQENSLRSNNELAPVLSQMSNVMKTNMAKTMAGLAAIALGTILGNRPGGGGGGPGGGGGGGGGGAGGGPRPPGPLKDPVLNMTANEWVSSEKALNIVPGALVKFFGFDKRVPTAIENAAAHAYVNYLIKTGEVISEEGFIKFKTNFVKSTGKGNLWKGIRDSITDVFGKRTQEVTETITKSRPEASRPGRPGIRPGMESYTEEVTRTVARPSAFSEGISSIGQGISSVALAASRGELGQMIAKNIKNAGVQTLRKFVDFFRRYRTAASVKQLLDKAGKGLGKAFRPRLLKFGKVSQFISLVVVILELWPIYEMKLKDQENAIKNGQKYDWSKDEKLMKQLFMAIGEAAGLILGLVFSVIDFEVFAVGGAAIGMAIGTAVFPIIGTAIGGIIGEALGLVAAFVAVNIETWIFSKLGKLIGKGIYEAMRQENFATAMKAMLSSIASDLSSFTKRAATRPGAVIGDMTGAAAISDLVGIVGNVFTSSPSKMSKPKTDAVSGGPTEPAAQTRGISNPLVAPNSVYDTIIAAEGTALHGDPYNESLGYLKSPKPLSEMTMKESLEWGEHIAATVGKDKRGRAYSSSAKGAFQIVNSTQRAAMKALGIKDTDKFSPDNQRRMADWIIANQGFKSWEGFKSNPDMLTNAKNLYGAPGATRRPPQANSFDSSKPGTVFQNERISDLPAYRAAAGDSSKPESIQYGVPDPKSPTNTTDDYSVHFNANEPAFGYAMPAAP